MSSESIALLRKNPASDELAQLAQEHLDHDLQQSDRDALLTAAKKFTTYATIGSLVGLGLGVTLAFRVRSSRTSLFNAFRAMEKPTHVLFEGGRTGTCLSASAEVSILISFHLVEAIPDLTPFLRPSLMGDIAAYFFFSVGGLFLGGEFGLLTGSAAAKRTITKDAQRKARIDTAMRRFRLDVLKKEVKKLEAQDVKV